MMFLLQMTHVTRMLIQSRPLSHPHPRQRLVSTLLDDLRQQHQMLFATEHEVLRVLLWLYDRLADTMTVWGLWHSRH
jgi:hypothetical protein